MTGPRSVLAAAVNGPLRRLADALMTPAAVPSPDPLLPHRPLVEAYWPGRCILCDLRPAHPRHGSAGLDLALKLARRP